MALSNTFAALGDPTRLAILERLAEGEATVTELAEPFAMSMPAISRHLKVLESAGLIERDRVGQSRPSRLRVEALEEAARWVVWQSRVDRLEQHLKEEMR